MFTKKKKVYKNSLTPDQVRDLFRAWENGDVEARNKIVMAYMALAHARARRAAFNFRVDVDECLSLAVEGLIEALSLDRDRRFDPEKGSFGNYAKWFITDKLKKVRHVLEPIHIPDHINDLVPVFQKFLETNGGDVNAAITSTLGTISSDKSHLAAYEKYLRTRHGKVCMGVSDDTVVNMSNVDDQDPDDLLTIKMLPYEKIVNKADLTDQERTILHGRFVDNCTLDHLGGVFTLSKERIRQLEVRALSKLRKAFECGGDATAPV